MRVAAIIPHWNRRDLLIELLNSLNRQTRPFDEIIVADNGSTDDSAELAEKAGARVLRLGSNLGFAAAVNRGIETTGCEWVAILNNDVTMEPAWSATLLAEAERQSAWFATGKTLDARRPGIIDGTFDEIARSGCAWRCGAGKPDSAIWNAPRVIRIAPMTAALFRRSLFAELGLLDEELGSYLEDVEFGIRCALAGKSGIYVPSAVAHHRGSATLGRWNSDTVRWIARNQVVLAAKYLRGQAAWRIMAGQLLWALVALRRGRAFSFIKGKVEGMRWARARAGAIRRSQMYEAVAVGTLLKESERTILELQRQTGFDWYWRLYFWLSPL